MAAEPFAAEIHAVRVKERNGPRSRAVSAHASSYFLLSAHERGPDCHQPQAHIPQGSAIARKTDRTWVNGDLVAFRAWLHPLAGQQGRFCTIAGSTLP